MATSFIEKWIFISNNTNLRASLEKGSWLLLKLKKRITSSSSNKKAQNVNYQNAQNYKIVRNSVMCSKKLYRHLYLFQRNLSPRFSKISLGFRAPATHLDQFFLAATLNLFIIIKPARRKSLLPPMLEKIYIQS